MIPQGVAIYASTEPVDMRWSFERLSGVALDHIGYDARSGALFLFCSKRGDAMKVLFHDGTGMCIFYKRLDKGSVKVPAAHSPHATHLELSDAELGALLEGIALEPRLH
jgi:transposase